MLLILIGVWIAWITSCGVRPASDHVPDVDDRSKWSVDQVPDGVESIWIRGSGTPGVEAWFIPGKGVSSETPGPVLVFAHGNGELIDDNLDLKWIAELGTSVLLVEYRGYGRSTGSPSQSSIVSDTNTFMKMLKARPDVDVERIGYMGRSIGSGVLAQVAIDHPPAAMIMIVLSARLDTMAWRSVFPHSWSEVHSVPTSPSGSEAPLLLLPRTR